MGDWNSWIISPEEFAKYDAQFQLLNPINGFLTGNQLKPYFLKFGLSVPTLGQIWSLADVDVDGNLNRKEFAIAMFLVNKSLAHLPLPPTLPPGLRNYSLPIIASTVPLSASFPHNMASTIPHTVHTNGEVIGQLSSQIENAASKTPDYQSWVISPETRPKYRLLFNQHDRLKRGYITGIEARGIFVKSGLSQQILAHIWTLADIDKDGNLNGDEFCIASFLIDKALAGNPLPATLPPGLLPSASRTSDQTSTVAKSDVRSDAGAISPSISFEDKRRENFLQGQIELDKRKQELAEKFRQEEQNRLEKERQERERQERIRQEQEERKALEAERQAEYLREIEAQKEIRRRQAFEERTQAWRAAEAQRLAEAERQRVEMLTREKLHAQTLFEQAVAHRASLLESATAQEQRRRELTQRLIITTDDLNAHKTAITEMRSKRDTYERDIRELTEQVEAAKAELTRWQREREELQLRQSTTSPTAELHKSLTASQSVHRDDIKRLNLQLVQLESRMTEQGQELARRRNMVGDMEQRCSLLQTEVDGLRQSLLGKLKSKQAQQFSSDAGSCTANHETYEVMFDFSATRSDELSLTTGSLVHVIPNPPVPVFDGWLYGESAGQKGLFPESYVRKRETGKIDPFDPFGIHRPAATAAAPASSDPPFGIASSQQQRQPPVSVDPSSHSIKKSPTSDQSGSKTARQILFKCLAIYPFESTVAGDLKLTVGDVIDVFNVRDEWWEGMCERTKLSGMFPANYAKKLPPAEDSSDQRNYNVDFTAITEPGEVVWPDSTLPPSQPASAASHAETATTTATTLSSDTVPATTTTSSPTQPSTEPCMTSTADSDTSNRTTVPELARVIAPYTATATGQLSLQLGQVVQVRKRSTNGWWEGELQQRGRGRQYGWFPADYVKLIVHPNASTNGSSPLSSDTTTATVTTSSSTFTTPASSINKSAAHSVSPKSNVKVMRAKFAYKAAHADELSFDEGAIITVISLDEPDWWRGRLKSTGAEGLFPVNYVDPLPQVTLDGVTEVPATHAVPTQLGS